MFAWREEIKGHGTFENCVVFCTISISVIGIINREVSKLPHNCIGLFKATTQCQLCNSLPDTQLFLRLNQSMFSLGSQHGSGKTRKLFFWFHHIHLDLYFILEKISTLQWQPQEVFFPVFVYMIFVIATYAFLSLPFPCSFISH